MFSIHSMPLISNFSIGFENGYSVDCAIGSAPYCNNHLDNRDSTPILGRDEKCEDCEIAVIKNGEFANMDKLNILPEDVRSDGGEVAGWVTPEQFLQVLNAVSKLPK